MIHKAPLQVLIILLLFSFALTSAAVPTTRGPSAKGEKSSIQTSLLKGSSPEFRNREDIFDVEEEFMVEGRMDLESNDYPGTGANNRHEPKTPGRA